MGSLPPDPNYMGVYLDGAQVPNGTIDGWTYAASADQCSARITLNGKYCDGLKNGDYKSFKALFGCPGKPLPPIL